MYVHHVASPFPLELPKHEDELIVTARDGTLRVLRAARNAGGQARCSDELVRGGGVWVAAVADGDLHGGGLVCRRWEQQGLGVSEEGGLELWRL